MMNRYGHFRYLDFPNGAKENAELNTNTRLQDGAEIDLLKGEWNRKEYQTLEQDSYLTRSPLPLYKSGEKIPFLTKSISDGNGTFSDPAFLDIRFSKYFSMTGITIETRSVVRRCVIEAFRDGELIASGEFSATTTNHFYSLETKFVNFIRITFYEIEEPYHFLGVYSVKFGRIKDFYDNDLVSATITSNFSVLGDTIEYDTADIVIINPEDIDRYLFQRKQRLMFIKNEESQLKLSVDSGDLNDDNTISVLAYDDISNLEDEFLGGIYDKKPTEQLIAEICAGRIEYQYLGDPESSVSGYIPVCTRRKALQMVLLAANIRCYKGAVFFFRPLQETENAEYINDTNIVGSPRKIKKKPVRSVQVNAHNYSKSKEQTELYHWYLSKTERTRIVFPNPMHSLKAYDVIGTDEHGNDIVSTDESENVFFYEVGANYCDVTNMSDGKVVIVGCGYIDSTSSVSVKNPLVIDDEVYYDYVVDMKLHEDATKACNILYSLYSKENSIRFKTLVDVSVGDLYNILGENYYIKKKKTNLDGIYEVEAV